MSKTSKKHNTSKATDWQGFFDEFANNVGSGPMWDRSIAILGCAFIDEQLTQLLTNHLIDNNELPDKLFGPNKPLSTLSSKIDICFALGLLGQITYDDLTKIRKIRNCFAHDLHNRSFDDNDIKSECENLQLIQVIYAPIHQSDFKPSDGRSLFITSVVLLSQDIAIRSLQAKAKRCLQGKDTKLGGYLSI